MSLTCVSISGADDGVEPGKLSEISAEFPFVEWGILLYDGHQGKRPRYPSESWLSAVVAEAATGQLRIALHLCGRWAGDPGRSGQLTIAAAKPALVRAARRVQLNFGNARKDVRPELLAQALREHPALEIILQANGDVDRELIGLVRSAGVNAVPLFDGSRGRGKAPKAWPMPIPGVVCGYAGGLRPESISEQLEAVAYVVGDGPVWVDMESGVRDEQDRFDLVRVRRCLEIASHYGAAR
jgi:hypothetical protein